MERPFPGMDDSLESLPDLFEEHRVPIIVPKVESATARARRAEVMKEFMRTATFGEYEECGKEEKGGMLGATLEGWLGVLDQWPDAEEVQKLLPSREEDAFFCEPGGVKGDGEEVSSAPPGTRGTS